MTAMGHATQELADLEAYNQRKLLTDNTWGCSDKGDRIRDRMWTLRRQIEEREAA